MWYRQRLCMNVLFLAELQSNTHLALVEGVLPPFNTDTKCNCVAVLQFLASFDGRCCAVVKGTVQRADVGEANNLLIVSSIAHKRCKY